MEILYIPTEKDQSRLIKGEVYSALMPPKNVIFLYQEDIVSGRNYHTDCNGIFGFGMCANGCEIRIATFEEKEFLLQKMKDNNIIQILEYQIY